MNMPPSQSNRRNQRGVTTLVVVLSLLVIISLLVLASSNLALFEQKTAVNENRQKLADQAAEYAINMSGEYIKSNLEYVATGTGTGWLVSSGASKRWYSCASALPFASVAHPCMAERDNGGFSTTSLTQIGGRRAQLYYYYNGTTTSLPYASLTGNLANTGGAGGASFGVTTSVKALLCRIDTERRVEYPTGSGVNVLAPDCALTPTATSLNRIAVTFIADTSINGESAASQVKETWASYGSVAGASAVPLIAAGSVEGLGNAEIVASANGAGIGLPVSIWSSCPVDIEKSVGQVYPANCVEPPGSGVGSVSTCNMGEFLKSTPEADYKSTCANSNPACGCPSFNTANSDFLSGHSNSQQRENIDILDKDNNAGKLPDITFFPDRGLDSPTDDFDDNLFEWIFGQDVVPEGGTTVNSCGALTVAGTKLCADVDALINTMGATEVATCASLGPTSSGLYYVSGDCDMPAQIGSPTESVIVVVDGDNQGGQGVRVSGNTVFYGMFFIRSRYTMDNGSNAVQLKGNGNVQFYGSVVVEGSVKITGGLRIVYENTNTDGPNKKLPATTRFARVPGSWLDASSSF
jgi:Tfp pilus assembly protein PilX